MTDINIAVRLPEIRDQLYEDISDCIDTARKKILDIKDDNYLLRHDIDEILDGSQPFDAHLDRFTFVLFVGYDSNLLTEPETPGFEDDWRKKQRCCSKNSRLTSSRIRRLRIFASTYSFIQPRVLSG